MCTGVRVIKDIFLLLLCGTTCALLVGLLKTGYSGRNLNVVVVQTQAGGSNGFWYEKTTMRLFQIFQVAFIFSALHSLDIFESFKDNI